MDQDISKIIAGAGGFITFAGDGQRSDLADVSGVAYSGAAIEQRWSDLKLVIDLAGMEVAPQIPLLYNHYNEPDCRLGEVVATIDGGSRLLVSGGIDQSTERGRFICEAGRKFSWQLSVGAAVDPEQVERVKDGEARTVNAREFTGPFLLLKKTFLREVSVCAVGADPDTSLKIAASLNLRVFPQQPHQTEGAQNMDQTEKTDNAALQAKKPEVKAAVQKPAAPAADDNRNSMTPEQITAMVQEQLRVQAAAEAKYRDEVRAAAGEYADIADKAIAAHWPVEQVKAVAEALAAAAPKGCGVNVIMRSGPAVNAKSIEAALCFQTGIPEKVIAAAYSEKDVEAGDQLRGITLQKVLELCCQMEGKTIPVMFGNETIRAAFSTNSLVGILGNVANKKALQSFTAQPVIATRLCKAGDLNDFKVSERYRLTDVGDLEIVTKSGEIKHGTVAEDKATNQLATYGKAFVLTRQDIYNDDLGAFLQIPAAMGQRAARKIDQLFFTRLLANPTFTDGNALFSAAHNNYLTGSNSALSKTALEAARNLFLAAADSDGQPINVAPKYLLVPSCLDSTGQSLVLSTALTGGSDAAPAINIINRFGLEVVSSPYLQSAAYAGYSTTGWYLFGDPAQIDTFEIGYLQGRRVPVVEQGAVDFTNLGLGFRVVYDLGVREQAYQGMVFNKGVA